MSVGKLCRKYRTALMGLAALSIFFFHEHQPLFTGVRVLGGCEALIKTVGCDGVEIFFLLSGIGLNFSYAKNPDIAAFYKRRLRRLALPFVLVGLLRLCTDRWSLLRFLTSITGLRFYLRDIYSLLWFVPAIMTLYLLFPLCYTLMGRCKSPARFTLYAITLWLLGAIVGNNFIRSDLYGFINRIPVFLIGIAVGRTLSDGGDIELSAPDYLAAALSGAVGVYLHYLTTVRGVILPLYCEYALSGTLVALAVSVLVPAALEAVSARRLTAVLGFFGEMSLEFYCLQEWIGERLLPHFSALPAFLSNLLLFAAVTAAARLLMRAVKAVNRPARAVAG